MKCKFYQVHEGHYKSMLHSLKFKCHGILSHWILRYKMAVRKMSSVSFEICYVLGLMCQTNWLEPILEHTGTDSYPS